MIECRRRYVIHTTLSARTGWGKNNNNNSPAAAVAHAYHHTADGKRTVKTHGILYNTVVPVGGTQNEVVFETPRGGGGSVHLRLLLISVESGGRGQMWSTTRRGGWFSRPSSAVDRVHVRVVRREASRWGDFLCGTS